MKHSRLWIALLFALVLVFSAFSGAVTHALAFPDGWQNLAPGIDFQKFTTSDPNQVFVARMDRSIPQATIDTSLANGKLFNLVEPGQGIDFDWESVRSQAQRYEGAINYWGGQWGQTNDVVVAINGYYYEDGVNPNYPKTGMPQQGQVLSGWYAKRFYDGESNSGFAWTLDGRAFVGDCVIHANAQQVFRYGTDLQETKNINLVNPLVEQRPDPDDDPNNSTIALYTPQFDRTTPINNGTTEFLIELRAPSLLVPSPDRVEGVVRGIGAGGGIQMPFDHVVLSVEGWRGNHLVGNVTVGDRVSISQKISNGCSNLNAEEPDWSRLYAGIGGDFHFVKDGVVNSYSENGGTIYRQPRTAIAFNDSHIFFIVVDGYHENVSIGMTIAQLGNFAIHQLGATEAVSLDSGTSTTMVVNGRTVNNTLCNANYEGQILSCGKVNIPNTTGAIPFPTPQAPVYALDSVDASQGDPPLVNGLMMISVKPAAFSASFSAGEVITTNAGAFLRLGPGTNYDGILSVPTGAQVTLLEHANGLNGVYATGSYWWKISYDGQEGWIPQAVLPWVSDFTFLPALRK